MKKKILLIATLLTLVTGCGEEKKNEVTKDENKTTTTVVTTEAIEETTTTSVVHDPTTKTTTKKVATTASKTTAGTTQTTTKADTATTQVATTTTTTAKPCDLKFSNKCYKIGDTITIEFTAKADVNVEDFRIKTYVTGQGAGSYDTLDVLGVDNPYMSSGTTSDPTDNGYEGFAWIRMNSESLAGGKKVYTLKYKVTNTGEYTLKYNVDLAADKEGNDVEPSSIKLTANIK